MADLTKNERKIIEKNLEEGRKAVQHIIWQINNPSTKILIPVSVKRGEGRG